MRNERQLYTRRIYPQRGRESKPVNNPQDCISPDPLLFREIEMIIPNPGSCFQPECRMQLTETTIHDSKRGIIKAVSLVPTGIKPLLPPKKIPVGGTRTIGGGTSYEAIRRAKRKSRRRS